MGAKNVVVLCAEWCGVCRDFKEPFQELGHSIPGWNFAWVDIEAHPDTADVDLETLPALIVAAADGKIVFLGPVLPKTGAIEQLLRGLESNAPIELSKADSQWVHAVIGSVRNAKN
jgi:thioredoxin-like negative regulator of GroEL